MNEYCGLDDDDVDDVENGLSTEKAALMNILSKDHMVALARLAVAFSPAGAAIDLRHIEAVQVLGWMNFTLTFKPLSVKKMDA